MQNMRSLLSYPVYPDNCTKFNDNNVVTLSQANQSVTLKCDSGTSFAPVNFENAFEEGDCNNERTLASLQLTGSTLVQGPSSDGKTPAYTLTVAKLPQDGPIKLCYRCNQAQLDLMRREAEPACIMRITVEADQRVDPELPNSDEAPPSEDSGSTHTSTSQTPTSGAVEEKPSLGSAILSACFLSHFALRVV
ncbi:SAG-related sequence [Besnoitia besnoiti]|uniref:SAG-related sequence n=1 Tax=Besnoitia besnoiti TaxID=94643 RepID=A0A2A9MEF1_BESBE|nr:SAG-related sequence [Besnoitia besnoiti]PFH36898.1 SAG-related sequence [Besnoitia besnoiti]